VDNSPREKDEPPRGHVLFDWLEDWVIKLVPGERKTKKYFEFFRAAA
jgi:hypothetical protein